MATEFFCIITSDTNFGILWAQVRSSTRKVKSEAANLPKRQAAAAVIGRTDSTTSSSSSSNTDTASVTVSETDSEPGNMDESHLEWCELDLSYGWGAAKGEREMARAG